MHYLNADRAARLIASIAPDRHDTALNPLAVPPALRTLREREPVTDHFQTALEASCGALITMESIRARMSPSCAKSAQALATQAIAELREAIAEITLAYQDRASALPRGFVIGAGPDWAPAAAQLSDQPSPRRTA